jgi:pimeloyl-ACP methyl ester carboxylesterase
MKEINLFEQVPKLKVPVYFLLGKYDQIVSSVLAAKYFEELQDPAGKQLFWFEHSAHRPYVEEPDKFFRLLVERILPETYNQEYGPSPPLAEHE